MAHHKRMPLPDKLSDLLAIALKDARWIQRQNTFRLEMGGFVQLDPYSGSCNVCMAGAVAINSCHVKKDAYIGGYDDLKSTPLLSKSDAKKLLKIDQVRRAFHVDLRNRNWHSENNSPAPIASAIGIVKFKKLTNRQVDSIRPKQFYSPDSPTSVMEYFRKIIPKLRSYGL